MDSIKEILEKLKDIEIKSNPMPFNMLYLAYQNVHGKEVLHSKLLAGLLNPNENHKLGDAPLKCFLHKIDVACGALQEVSVETEKNVNGRRIDIFVSWKDEDNESKKHAVIIENKLHNAGSQKNQLNAYYDGTKDEYSIEKIVYLPFDKSYGSFKYTDIRSDLHEKCIDIDAKWIVKWLEDLIKDNEGISILEQYKEFFKCLINTKFIYMKAEEILQQLNNKDIFKLENLGKIMRDSEWCEALFSQKYSNLLTKLQQKVNGLQVKYKQNHNYVNYVQLYFDNWKNNYWYEIWLYEDGFYCYKYDRVDYSDTTYFTYNDENKVVKHLVPLLTELSKQS